MNAALANPNVKAALERAGLFPPPPEVSERLTSACEHPEVEPDGILEISRADWGTEDQSADDVLVVQTKAGLYLIVQFKRGLLRSTTTARIRCLYEWYRDLVDDDEILGSSVVFLAKQGHHDFLLSFPTAHERNRMYPCLFEAHRGLFARWGLQLNPADFSVDFERYHAELAAAGPDESDRLHEWVAKTYGEFDAGNALGLAVAWRSAELSDRADQSRAARVGMLGGGHTWWSADRQPESRRTVVRLCEQLYDDGLLGPPYDERTFTDDPLGCHDAGPKRLLVLMTLAAFAHALRDPRASEWIEAARQGIPAVPPAVFPEKLRDLWAGIQALPAPGTS